MFFANVNNLRPSFSNGEYNLSELELLAFIPFFMCVVPKFDDSAGEAICASTYLIGDVNRLLEFSNEHNFDKTYILSPGYMTKTDNWSLLRLKSMAEAIYEIDNNQNNLYRFEIEDGQFLYYNLSGNEKLNTTVKFKTILEFN